MTKLMTPNCFQHFLDCMRRLCKFKLLLYNFCNSVPCRDIQNYLTSQCIVSMRLLNYVARNNRK